MFNVGIKVIDKAKRQKIREEIMKKLDMLENDFLPQVKLVPKSLLSESEVSAYSLA